MTPQQKG